MKPKHFLSIIFFFTFLFGGFSQEYDSKTTQTVSPVVANFTERAIYEQNFPLEKKIPTKKQKNKLYIPPYEMPTKGVELFTGSPIISTQALSVAPPAPTTTFTGLIDDNTSIPPDVNGAIGANHAMTTLNTSIRIQSKTGTTLSTVSGSTFWTNEQTSSIYDPKILYDSFSQRYYFVELDGAESATSNILLGVSQTNDPTGNWYQYRFKTNNDDLTLWLDFPTIGYNKDWLVVSGNMFTVAANAFTKVKLFVIKKSDILAGTVTTPTEISVAQGFTIAPAVVADNTTTTVPLMCTWNNTTGTYKLFRINGVPPTTPTLTDVGFPSVGSANKWFAYTWNWNQAPQLGMTSISNGMDDGDHRMANLVLRNGKLWATHNTFSTNTGTESSTAVYRGVVRWLSINPSTAAINEWGKIEDTGITNMGTFSVPTNSYSYPSIAVNAYDDVMIGVEHHSPTIYGTASYLARKSGETSFSSIYDYKTGVAKYYKTYGGSANRWGDYTMTMLDPTNDIDFWFLGEYAETPGGGYDKWGTQWAKVCTSPIQPSTFTSSTATVCQGANNVAYTVPSVTGATGYTWSYSGTGATITGTTNSITVNFSNTATSGTLSVSATNSCGNSSARTLAITVNPKPAQPSAFTTSSSSVCQGATNVVYTVPIVANATGYSWNYSGTGATITGTTNSVTVSFSPTATSGTLSVSATNSCGNSAARTLAGTVTATPAIPTTSASKLIICSGGSTTLSASGCAGTVTWSNGAGTGSSISVSPTSDISYTATCSINSCLSGVSNSVSIKVIPQNLAVSSSTSPPFEAKDNITTTGNITISGTQTYKAGKSISLTSTPTTSISTAPGTVFTAKIEGCNY